MKSKPLVFLTGATGNMGTQTLIELLKRSDRFCVRALVLNTESERRKIARFKHHENLECVFGDMRDARLIERCVHGVDYVLHIGALVSPMADKHPQACMRINYDSTLNIINAIKKQENANQIALVYVGTVGETGCRMPPIHWGRCGDPIKPSIFDYYSVSKVASERAVIESGLSKWVSLRQTGMLPINKAGLHDPIIFHQNLNNVLEWITSEESGRLMANVCEEWVPDHFWRNCYNIGGGKLWRFTNYELMEKSLNALGVDIKKCFDPRNFALFNFHGQWFTDSDKLNDILKFRFIHPDDYFLKQNKAIRILKTIPFVNLLLPGDKRLKKTYNKLKYNERGTGWMIEHHKADWIKAFYGSEEKKNAIKSWEEGYQLIHPSKKPTYLNHGYDESVPTAEYSLKDMQAAAAFRGGFCVSEEMKKGMMYLPLRWQCHKGHEFEASPYLILKAGHWCPVCEAESWNYPEMAKHNPFFAQVWNPLHDGDEDIYVKKVFE